MLVLNAETNWILGVSRPQASPVGSAEARIHDSYTTEWDTIPARRVESWNDSRSVRQYRQYTDRESGGAREILKHK